MCMNVTYDCRRHRSRKLLQLCSSKLVSLGWLSHRSETGVLLAVEDQINQLIDQMEIVHVSVALFISTNFTNGFVDS